MNYNELSSMEPGEPSSVIRERVIRARKTQQERFSDLPHVHCNANMGARELAKYGLLQPEAQEMMKMAINFSDYQDLLMLQILNQEILCNLLEIQQLHQDLMAE